MRGECRPNCFRSAHGSSATLRVSEMRESLSGRPPAEELLVLGAVSRHGFCAVHLPREPARYRGVSAVSGRQALSHGVPEHVSALHAGRCQRVSGLEDLCRLCPSPDRRGATALLGRSDGRRTRCQPLCAGLDHHRSVSFLVSVGAFSPAQSRDQTAHPAGPAWQYPHVYWDYRRQSA